MFRPLAFWPLLALIAAHGSPLSPEEALKSFELAPGLQIELVAAEPLVTSPCALAFDERGRLFVAENNGYPRTSEPPQGRIVMLESTKGDGHFDKRTVFGEGLTYPNGVMPWQGGLLVTCAPDLLFLKDTHGDGHADERRVLLTGFDTTGSTQLRVNKPLLGPDGWIWLATGLRGGHVTNPAHPEYPPLDLKSDLRFDPRSGHYEPVDGRSQYGHDFDANGSRFICMNRIQAQHVVLSSSHLRRNPNLAFSDTVQNCPDTQVPSLLHGGGGAARVFPISANLTTADSHAGTFTAACGVAIWTGAGALPDYRGHAFSCEPTGNLVHVDKLWPVDGTYAARPLFKDREFLASRDDWFRPVYLAPGPDGALYICDMYRQVIEHPDYLPEEIRKHTDFEAGKTMGRIWRVRAKDIPTPPTPSFTKDVAALTNLLTTDNAWVRETATRLLVESSPSQLPPISDGPIGDSRWLRTRHRLSPLSDAELEAALNQNPDAVANGVIDILAEDLATSRRTPALLVRLGEPPVDRWTFDPLRYAVALGAVRDDAIATPLLIKTARKCQANARWLSAAIIASSAGRELAVLRGILADAGQQESPVTSLLAETLGRADRARNTSSLPELLAATSNSAYSRRASLAAAYAGGRALLLDPASPEVQSLLQETERLFESDPAATIPVLAHAPWAWGGARLLSLGAKGNSEALKSLASWDQPEIPPTLLASLAWQTGSPKLRSEMLAVCLSRPGYFPAVLDAIESHTLPTNLLTPQQRQLFLKSKDPGVRERAGKLVAAAGGDRMKAYESAKAVLDLTGSGTQGHEVFKRACTTCHRLDREGQPIGPDLLDIRSQPKASILLHVVVPNFEIAPGFAASIVETRDGRTLAGIVSSETPESITLRAPGSGEQTLPRESIATITASPLSLMPDGLETAMSAQDMANLLAYLKGEL